MAALQQPIIDQEEAQIEGFSAEVFDNYETCELEKSDQYTYDFLGVQTNIEYHKNWAKAGGRQKPKPLTSWEWISLLWAVETSKESVTLVECGAGWGPWVGRGYVAARTRAKKNISIIAVEGEPTHFEYMKEHFEDNGIPESDADAVLGVVSAESGFSMFPIAPDPQTAWGLRSIKSNSKEKETMLAEIGAVPAEDNPGLYTIPKRPGFYAIQRSVTLEDLIKNKKTIDYIHFDIQGSEGEVIESSLAIMNDRVRCIFIGTHSHEIEAQLKTRENGSLQDGEQVWVNPRFI